MNEVYRQGDVLIQRVTALPKGESKPVNAEAGRLILAYGEVTRNAKGEYSWSITTERSS